MMNGTFSTQKISSSSFGVVHGSFGGAITRQPEPGAGQISTVEFPWYSLAIEKGCDTLSFSINTVVEGAIPTQIMFIYPPIEQLAGRMVKEKYYKGLANSSKNTEIVFLRTKRCVAPLPLQYSHVVFRQCKIRTKRRKVSNMVGKMVGCVGPSITAIDAYSAAMECNLKLGMGLEELERFMTRPRKDKKTKQTGQQVIPVMFNKVSCVHRIYAVEWIYSQGNQAGFRHHDFQPKDKTLDRVCLFRYHHVGGDFAAALASNISVPPAAGPAVSSICWFPFAGDWDDPCGSSKIPNRPRSITNNQHY
jgi:hypothetical protein